MEERHRRALRKNRVLLIDKLPTSEVIDYLFKTNILTKYMVEDLVVEQNIIKNFKCPGIIYSSVLSTCLG